MSLNTVMCVKIYRGNMMQHDQKIIGTCYNNFDDPPNTNLIIVKNNFGFQIL